MFLLITILSCSKTNNLNKGIDLEEKDDATEDMDFNENEYEKFTKKYHNEDEGTILSIVEKSELDGDDIIEKVYVNEISNKKIYYTGAEYRGEGIFWIYNNGIRKKILEIPIRYEPKIIWHGNYVVEILIPTGSPFRHSYYFYFLDNRLSKPYYFPLYYDVENDVVLTWGNVDFELYNLKTDELICEYSFRRMSNLIPAWPYVKYYIIKHNDQIILFYDDDYDKKKGYFIMDIRNKNKINVIYSQNVKLNI